LPKVESGESGRIISENAEFPPALSRFRELSWPTGADSRHGEPPVPAGRRDGETRAADTLIHPRTTVAEYIEGKFVPEYIVLKTSAGRVHFQSVLKFILTPTGIERAFKLDWRASKHITSPLPNWPYMDSLALCEVTRSCVEKVISEALNRGYSVQTATHIRNVIRTMFAHATQTHFFFGENPTLSVTLPRMLRKPAYVLTLDELKRILQVARYPEKEIALMATLTRMSIAEICGLQWKYVNASELRRPMDGDWLEARTIAVRMQSCRGEFGPVIASRRQDVRLPELLIPALAGLRARTRFSGPNDFIFASRSGSPVSQDNLAIRKLKVIGKALGVPWLSWHAFRRTHEHLYAQLGRQLHNELKSSISSERTSLLTH
jgi:integrase